MAKRWTAGHSTLKPDPRYESKLAAKFINSLMWSGKKSVAQRIFYQAMDQIKKRVKDKEEIEVFNQAIDNAKPMIEVRSKRVGGATYQVPMQVKSNRQQTLAFRWIIGAARGKKGRPMHLKLADELVAAFNREGAAMEKRETVHKMADANKAFAHFAW